jgi:23S rRNA pseudouridine2457 synthase
MIVLLNKPFNVLCQFSPQNGLATLKNYISISNLYPSGRLDKDSEGLVVLTDDGRLQHLISHPKHKLEKRYWVQVEGIPDTLALSTLRQGVVLKDGITAPAQVKTVKPPELWPRIPPIRYRANIPTTWLEISLREGRNRQVRRMTAAVGHPTLRLIRVAIGPWVLNDLQPGEYQQLELDFAVLPDYWRTFLSTTPANHVARKKKTSRWPQKRKSKPANHIK